MKTKIDEQPKSQTDESSRLENFVRQKTKSFDIEFKRKVVQTEAFTTDGTWDYTNATLRVYNWRGKLYLQIRSKGKNNKTWLVSHITINKKDVQILIKHLMETFGFSA